VRAGLAHAAAHDRVELEVHEDVPQRPAVEGEAGVGEHRRDLRAGQRPAGDRRLDRPAGGGEQVVVEAELMPGAGGRPPHPGRGQGQQPAQVLPADVVPGGPQDVRAQQPAVVAGLRDDRLSAAVGPLPDRPRRGLDVLRLHSEQVTDDLLGRCLQGTGQPGGGQPPEHDFPRVHGREPATPPVPRSCRCGTPSTLSRRASTA